jgi:NAD-dependent DNA ligase
MTDSQYDILQDYILKTYPDNEIAKEGHKMCEILTEKNKVKLPYEMWSMDKIKPDTKAIDKWTKTYKGPYVLSAKLDGISALYTSGKNSKDAKFYTRGNGIEGQDITNLIPYIIWKNNPIHSFEIEFSIRGEIIINKETFNKKYSTKFANPRNFVAGIVNKKTIDIDLLIDLDFVPYEVINPILEPSLQMKFIKDEWIIEPVKHVVVSNISNEILSKILIEWRDNYKYEIDGIICTNDKIYERPKGNPEYAFAFKMVLSDQIAEAKVIDILWTPSKDGYLSPRVQIEPVKLKGSTINFITGKNAKFIEDNKIGIGAIVKLVKAGDVIPEIASVIQPASEPLFPSEPYVWNESHVEIMLINKEEDERVIEKNIETFFKTLEVDGLGPGLINRIVEAGYNSVASILAMTENDFLKIEGFKKKLAEKIYNNIHKQIEKASLSELMAGSNVFGRGFGEKKFTLILAEIPNILTSTENESEKIKLLNKVSGLAQKTSEKFVKKIPEFIKFLEQANLQNKLDENKSKIKIIEKHILNNKNIVTSGFRFDKQILEKLEKINVTIQNAINKETDMLIVKDMKDESTKILTAKEKNIPIISRGEFLDTYDLF